MTGLLAYLQAHAAAEGAAGAAEHGAGGGGHHVSWITTQVNNLLGGVVLSIERAIMPQIYGLFGATWHEPAPGEMVIPEHVVMIGVLFLIAIILALLLRGKLSIDRPSKGQQVLEIVVGQIRELLDQVIGPYGRRYVPVIGSFALFILIGNLMGQIPGVTAPTENINVTGALGLSSFLYYMGSGFRQQGFKYLMHFFGGLKGVMLFAIGPLIFLVELLSNSVRPVTLSLRLFVNMYADTQIGVAFLELVAPIVPLFTIVLGLFVAFVQTFIFIMLSMVYLSETVPHDDHEHEEHGQGRDEVLAEAH